MAATEIFTIAFVEARKIICQQNEITQNFMQHFNISSFNVSSKSEMLLATGCQKNIHDVCGHEVILLVTDLTSMLPSGGSNDRPG